MTLGQEGRIGPETDEKEGKKFLVFSSDPPIGIKDRPEEEVIRFDRHVPLLSLATYSLWWWVNSGSHLNSAKNTQALGKDSPGEEPWADRALSNHVTWGRR